VVPRSALLSAGTVALLGVAGGAAAWWWWTAPPSGSGTRLALAAHWAPADAEGVVVVAQAPRLARWLARHRAAGPLAAAVAPAALAGARPVEPMALPLVRTARGPLVAWWGTSSTGLAAQVTRADLAGLRQVAALRGLGWREERGEGDFVGVWAFTGTLGASPVLPATPPPAPGGGWSALVKLHGWWWHIRLTRGGLTARSGTPPPLPNCGGETRMVSGDLSSLLGRSADTAAVPGALLVAADGGWGVRLGEASSGTIVERVVRAVGEGRERPGDPSTLQWDTPWGTLVLAAESGGAVATRPELLARLPLATPGSQWGCLRGEEVAGALTGTAALLARLPGGPSHQQIASAAKALQQVKECSWRLEPSGGQLQLRW